jgi:hypothetical protein
MLRRQIRDRMHSTHAPRSVLVVGHPGHELRVYGWLMGAHAVVHVLTDGSGSDGESRIASTSALLNDLAAPRGSIYGRMSDRDIYAAMLAGDHTRFIDIADELADGLVADRVEDVAGDAIEGFNPSHDVCRYVINAAVRMAVAATGRAIGCYAFALENPPHQCPDELSTRAMWVQLDEQMLGQKLNAAFAYTPLRSEVQRTLDRFGTEPFRTECLWPVDLADPYGWDPDRVPYYESYGAQRVASGAYEQVVTFRDHVKPLAEALWCHSVRHR